MKQARHDKSIPNKIQPAEFELKLQQLKQAHQAEDSYLKDQNNKYSKLGLNWKDVVIFSLVMIFTTFYNVNAHAGSCAKPRVNSYDNYQSQNLSESVAIDFNDISSGMMMEFNKATGEYHSLKLVQTKYDVDVSGLLATIKLSQTFFNDQNDWISESVYAFPMADKAAVYQLKMIIGERVIEGEIHEKHQAEQIYEQAKAEGLTATLVKQYRPNIFTSDISNIGPQEMITVEITYQMSLEYQQDFYELRLPMAIKPRYVPDSMAANLPAKANITDQNYRHIEINLNAGFDLFELRSLHHDIDIVHNFDHQLITLKDQQLYDNNDFVLRWYPTLEQTPKAAYFSEQIDGFEYSLLMVMPPNRVEKTSQPRNITYIMDTSGSMHGMAMDQTKDALLFALSEMDDRNYFNVVDFDSTAKPLFTASRPATPENISLALDFVDNFSANGGTNMAPALQIAMQAENIKSGYLNQIIFMTDGAVGNEATIFDQITREIGDARLFTVAIGPAPNNYFMSKAALFGRGTYTHIAALDQVNESMGRLFSQLSRPALTDVAVTWNTSDVEQSPSVIADLYMDQPLIITSKTPINKARSNKTKTLPSFVVSGLSGDSNNQKAWSEQIELKNNKHTTGIARLWARNKVAEMTDDLMLNGDHGLLKDDIIELALQHHLITEFTAMVAVDRNPDASRLAARRMANRSAQAKAMGQVPYPQGSLGWRWNLMLGLLMMSMAVLLNRRFN